MRLRHETRRMQNHIPDAFLKVVCNLLINLMLAVIFFHAIPAVSAALAPLTFVFIIRFFSNVKNLLGFIS